MSKHHGVGTLKGMTAFCHKGYRAQEDNRFGRMFKLPALYTPPGDLKNLGGKGGPMDGGTTTNRTVSVPAGDIFFGQFIDHDITLDVTSSLTATTNADEIENVRTPSLDLDSIYGMGPEGSNFLYFQNMTGAEATFNGVKLLTGAQSTAYTYSPTSLADNDLSRTAGGTAIIGDFRNDENRIISQLHLAIIRFHNHVVDKLHADYPELEGDELFTEARRIVTWHYQWVVINDFLVKLCGAPVVTDILGNGRKIYCVNPDREAFIPIEFAVAAYRFGHSMIPQSVQIQSGGGTLDLFGPTLGRGFQPLSDAVAIVDWNELVDAGGSGVQMSEKLDSQLAETLLDLPFVGAGQEVSLATRNLLRGQTFLLPSGENVAREIAASIGHIDTSMIESVSNAAQAKATGAADLSSGTPLWYYILVEAGEIGRETVKGLYDPGEGLGPVGARIVAETIIGLIELDERSFLSVNRNWQPSDTPVGVSTLGEMLTYTP